MTDDPGSRFLFELSTSCSRSRPPTPAVLLERWRERPEVVAHAALAGEEMPGIEESSARRSSWPPPSKRWRMEPTLRRHEELIAKGELTEDERAELKELNVAMHMAQEQGDRAVLRRPARPADKFFARVTLLARILRCFRGQTRAEVVDRLAIFALSSHRHLRRMRPLSRKPP